MYDAIHLTNFVLCCACAGLKLWESGNSLDDFAPVEDTPLGSEKSCTLISQAAQEMLEMHSESPQGASPAAAESFSEPRHQQEGVQTTFWTVICTFFHKILQNHCFFQCLY